MRARPRRRLPKERDRRRRVAVGGRYSRLHYHKCRLLARGLRAASSLRYGEHGSIKGRSDREPTAQHRQAIQYGPQTSVLQRLRGP